MDPLQWMGAVRMRIQTADKNITVIHTTPGHQSTSYEAKMSVSNTQIHYECVFNFKLVLSAKNEPSIPEVFNPAPGDPLSWKVYFQPASAHLPAIFKQSWGSWLAASGVFD